MMKFRYTILYVADVATALDFYKAAFGFEIGFLHEGKDYGELITGDTKLAFSSRDLMRQLGEAPMKPSPESPSFGLSFETDHVAADLERALAAGAALHKPIIEQPWGQTTCAVSDLDGYVIELCSAVTPPDAV